MSYLKKSAIAKVREEVGQEYDPGHPFSRQWPSDEIGSINVILILNIQIKLALIKFPAVWTTSSTSLPPLSEIISDCLSYGVV